MTLRVLGTLPRPPPASPSRLWEINESIYDRKTQSAGFRDSQSETNLEAHNDLHSTANQEDLIQERKLQ